MAEAGDPGACEEETAKTLDTVLSSLYDFGETFEANKKKVVKKKAIASESRLELESPGSAAVLDSRAVCPSSEASNKRSISGFFETLKGELQHESASRITGRENVPTSSAMQQGQGPPVEVVKFLSRNEKKVKGEGSQEKGFKKAEANIQQQEEEDRGVFNFEKARLEVHKFGITGYKKDRQRTFEQERAIMLGAKPPKKEYLNYKIYQDKIKQKSAEKQETTEKEFKSDFLKKKKRKGGPEERRTKKKKSSSNILPSRQVGKFKNGTLLLSGKDVKKIKSSKVIK
ncbi:40S small subunit processome assembly factor 1 [Microcaecilia unicolor]|uniref:Uncharacterized protein C1orf131 homolog n=1 Tax=Microcaecilia unicolor TaxID=1415580 RepID=A0A6P7XIN6_9AMPH|nr:uncharacterized protein C1orf131 homolog [Microcaecilia unicolor]